MNFHHTGNFNSIDASAKGAESTIRARVVKKRRQQTSGAKDGNRAIVPPEARHFKSAQYDKYRPKYQDHESIEVLEDISMHQDRTRDLSMISHTHMVTDDGMVNDASRIHD